VALSVSWVYFSDDGATYTQAGTHAITGGVADRSNYQYVCLDTPIAVNAGGRYGVSAPDKTATTPPKWGRVYMLYDEGLSDVYEYPCGQHIAGVCVWQVRHITLICVIAAPLCIDLYHAGMLYYV
jgi:hypothetical protein